jgi:hypothetical protein
MVQEGVDQLRQLQAALLGASLSAGEQVILDAEPLVEGLIRRAREVMQFAVNPFAPTAVATGRQREIGAGFFRKSNRLRMRHVLDSTESGVAGHANG